MCVFTWQSASQKIKITTGNTLKSMKRKKKYINCKVLLSTGFPATTKILVSLLISK